MDIVALVEAHENIDDWGRKMSSARRVATMRSSRNSNTIHSLRSYQDQEEIDKLHRKLENEFGALENSRASMRKSTNRTSDRVSQRLAERPLSGSLQSIKKAAHRSTTIAGGSSGGMMGPFRVSNRDHDLFVIEEEEKGRTRRGSSYDFRSEPSTVGLKRESKINA